MKRTSFSHRERTARIKIIQELHCNKAEQHLLDQYASTFQRTYRKIHDDIAEGYILMFMAEIGARRMAQAIAKTTYSAEAASLAFKELFAQLIKKRISIMVPIKQRRIYGYKNYKSM